MIGVGGNDEERGDEVYFRRQPFTFEQGLTSTAWRPHLVNMPCLRVLAKLDCKLYDARSGLFPRHRGGYCSLCGISTAYKHLLPVLAMRGNCLVEAQTGNLGLLVEGLVLEYCLCQIGLLPIGRDTVLQHGCVKRNAYREGD